MRRQNRRRRWPGSLAPLDREKNPNCVSCPPRPGCTSQPQGNILIEASLVQLNVQREASLRRSVFRFRSHGEMWHAAIQIQCFYRSYVSAMIYHIAMHWSYITEH